LTTINSILIILIWISSVLLAAIACRRYFPAQKEFSRKIVHIGTGPVIPLAWALKIPSNLAIPCAATITIALLINHRLQLISAIEEVNRKSYGTIAYAFSITFLLIFLWPENASSVCAGVLAMSFGDGFAGLIGRQLNTPSWIIFDQTKSIGGTLTMALTVFCMLIILALVSGVGLHPLLLLVITLLAVGLEQIGPWGIDNLTVPIGVAYGWLWLNP